MPVPRTHPVYTRLSEPDLRLLRSMAKRNGLSPSSQVKAVVEAELVRERKRREKAKATKAGVADGS